MDRDIFESILKSYKKILTTLSELQTDVSHIKEVQIRQSDTRLRFPTHKPISINNTRKQMPDLEIQRVFSGMNSITQKKPLEKAGGKKRGRKEGFLICDKPGDNFLKEIEKENNNE